jgi:hypothetical protein
LLINYSDQIYVRDETISRDDWRRKCSGETWSVLEECERIVKEIDPELSFLYKVGYIGLQKNEEPDNFVRFFPNPTFIRVAAKVTEGMDFAEEIKALGMEFLSIGKRNGRVKFRINKRTVVSNKDFLKRMFLNAYQNLEPSDDLNGNLSYSRKFQLDFWSRFRDRLLETQQVTSLKTLRPQYWFDLALGKSHIYISATCNTSENIVSVKVYVGNRIASEMFPFLESRKDEIERHIGQKLVWNPYPEKQNKRIVLDHSRDLADQKNRRRFRLACKTHSIIPGGIFATCSDS